MSELSRIPAVVQRFIASEAVCDFIHLCTFGEAPTSIPSDAFKTAAASAAPTTGASKPKDADDWRLLYDVMKVDKQRVLFADAHMERITTSYASLTHRTLSDEEAAFAKAALQQYVSASTTTETPAQNVKYMSWIAAQEAPQPGTASDESTTTTTPFTFVLYFIHSFFPPAQWYETGTTMALLYNAHRENPNAKVVQATLRERATALQKSTGTFEALLVHDKADGYLIPEGSRSNYFLVSQSDALLCSAEADILIGITLRAARRAAEKAGLGAVHHQRLTLKDLCEAKSMVMLGTSPGTLPVHEILLYNDAESKAQFDSAAQHCGVDVGNLKAMRVLSEDPPKAVLTFEVHNRVVDELMKAYRQESVA